MNIAIKQFKCKSQLLTQKGLTRKCIKNELGSVAELKTKQRYTQTTRVQSRNQSW